MVLLRLRRPHHELTRRNKQHHDSAHLVPDLPRLPRRLDPLARGRVGDDSRIGVLREHLERLHALRVAPFVIGLRDRPVAEADHERHGHQRDCTHSRFVPPQELPRAVPNRVGPRADRPPLEVTVDVAAKLKSGLVPVLRLLAHRLERDPLELALELLRKVAQPHAARLLDAARRVGVLRGQRRQPRARRRRIDFADHPLDLAVGLGSKLPRLERQRARHQLVQQHPKRVDIAARVDVACGRIRLLRAHVLGRADHLPGLGEDRVLAQPLRQRLRHAEVDHLQRELSVRLEREHIRRLQIAMHETLDMRVLHRVARLREQTQPLSHTKPACVAEVRDRVALHILHRKVRPTRRRQATIDHLRDVRMVHHRKRLPLLLEARDHALRVHARLDDLERDALREGMPALGQPHCSKTTLAELRDEFVRTNLVTGPFERAAVVPRRLGTVCHAVVEVRGRFVVGALRHAVPRVSALSTILVRPRVKMQLSTSRFRSMAASRVPDRTRAKAAQTPATP